MSLVKQRPKVWVEVEDPLPPGEVFHGQVFIRADKPVPVDAIALYFVGEERVLIPLGKAALVRSSRPVDLAAKLSGHVDLKPGTRSYPFSFRVPTDAPPSFEAEGVRVRYQLRVHVDIPWWPDRRAKLEGQLHLADLGVEGRLGGCEVEVQHRALGTRQATTSIFIRPRGSAITQAPPISALGDAAPRGRRTTLRATDGRLELCVPFPDDPLSLVPAARALVKLARQR